MLAGPRALINHAALRHNLSVVRRFAPSSRVWAVIKADAYGHGMVQAAHGLAGADGYAVARLEEAVRLREAGVEKPVLVLEGAFSREEVDLACRHRLELALHHRKQIALLEQRPDAAMLPLWIKVDTGMHRLGMPPDAVPAVLDWLSRCPQPPGLMTHLANSDDSSDPLTDAQCERLRALAGEGGYRLSIGNSAGIVAWPGSRTDWVRPGIMLYGASPLQGRSASDLGLRPVMTLRTQLIAVNRLRRGDAVGYSGTWVCPEDMPVGVAAVGYGDGYPRQAPSGTPVLIRGCRLPIVGRVSMDLITIDLRGLPEARVGDAVTLWGEGLPVDEIAGWAGTIAYELLCRLTRRVRVDYQATAADAARLA
jgi:alanine racemase